MGRHGWVSYAGGTGLPVGRSARLPPREVPDFREYLFDALGPCQIQPRISGTPQQQFSFRRYNDRNGVLAENQCLAR